MSWTRDQDSGRFADRWLAVQHRFVQEPAAALGEANALVAEVADGVADPEVREHREAAAELSARARRGEASPHDLRQAMVHYRTLLNQLLVGRG